MDPSPRKRTSTAERISHVLISVALLGYGGFGLYRDDLFIPGKRGPGIHMHGIAALGIFCACVCASLNLLGALVDHFNSSEDEMFYHQFARITLGVGAVLYLTSFFYGAYHQ
jgi:hypothetical protein